ncbi:tyrosine-type recombinase/integrase [Paenibacillus foliorum]|uniref:tyrosine-type recombinase/integrase n=1 Tax=Paenibacillus foliorum TaxID=2654974 RepID=UPI001FE2D4A6|nr:tyrosine-type recombinase/integrase [Paenibacillus foliorum]
MDKRIPKFLIEEDVIHLKISCLSLRERALLEFLYSTGCRFGEVQKINIEDLNWERCSAIVNGKGSKQREVLDNGAHLEFIQGMLGHEKASTTQIYAQLRGERRRELYRRFFWYTNHREN